LSKRIIAADNLSGFLPGVAFAGVMKTLKKELSGLLLDDAGFPDMG
jgi:hypothetical protein